jgi:ABC transport system ATP-binding/permease protein
MSKQILKALMQLFAIIARPESNSSDRRFVVESFLKRQLNQDLVNEYLKIFDDYYNIHQERQGEISKRKKRTSSSSVRVLLICTEINEELTQRQKIIVFVNLLEFVKSDNGEITEQEMAFITTVAETFNINNEEFTLIKDFVLFPFKTIPASEKILIISNDKDFDLTQVRHLLSDGLHGQIRILHVETSNIYLMRYIGGGELYLNSQLIQQDKVYAFDTGSSIRNPKIKPVYYSDIVNRFNIDKLKAKIIFEVRDLEYRFKGGTVGLQKVSFIEESGRLIGIMGSSGSGKSTLLNTLNGTLTPSLGQILINGIDIHDEKEKIEGLIGHVSQDDLLIEELTVFENLYYNAKLCFDNYTEEEIVKTVNTLLHNLGLYETRDIQVGSPLNKKISGGQRKRLNIALELIREPAILFLDEPTSGLSSRDSENILDLLKELSLKGKLVFVVIHQPSSDIFKMFDKLLILDTGGHLIYNGDPVDSIIYFKSYMQHANWNESECHVCGNVNPEQIFNIVETNVLDEYGRLTLQRKITPKEWTSHYCEVTEPKKIKPEEYPVDLPEITFKIPNKLNQFLVFVKRDLLSKLSNTQYLIINLFEAPLLAFLLAYIIRYFDVNVTNKLGYTFAGNINLPVYIFMSVIVAIFIGLTVSAEEIIKDRKILKREAFLNLSWSSYLFSKIFVLFGISAIQAFLFVITGNSIMEIKGMYFQYWLVLFSAWCFSNILGLVISDSFKTVITIYILIPFLVIPQLILSGIIVKYENLNPAISSPSRIPIYGEIITARWAYEALAVYQFTENKFEREFYPYNKVLSFADYRKNFWIRNLINKIDFIERNMGNEQNRETVISHLYLLREEISKELIQNSQVKFPYISQLHIEKLNAEVVDATRDYLNLLNRYYIMLYNKANSERDKIISAYHNSQSSREDFLARKNKYQNEALSDLVRNSKEIERIVEYKGKLHQKIDPIYQDPEGRFLKAHFYSPFKMIFGYPMSTYWANILVIWSMVVITYLALYFRLLKKGLDAFERIGEVKKKLKGASK